MANRELSSGDFESLLEASALALTALINRDRAVREPKEFESAVRRILHELAPAGVVVDLAPRGQTFPDIAIGNYGVEVKVTNKDSWRSVANSVLESTRDLQVGDVYLIFGKMGGRPEVRWAKYGDSIVHVRTSHVPRFEVEIDPKDRLFDKLGTSYDHFRVLPIEEKMSYIRRYARGRLNDGEHLWWLEDRPEDQQEHAVELKVQLYMHLPQEFKRRLRAEVALLCPQVVKPSRAKKKYVDGAMYLITNHGVLATVRDLFSAGSVALRADAKRGGNYVERALLDIEQEMLDAARSLPEELFEEYWGQATPPERRIEEWLQRADGFAKDWKPSHVLFRSRKT